MHLTDGGHFVFGWGTSRGSWVGGGLSVLGERGNPFLGDVGVSPIVLHFYVRDWHTFPLHVQFVDFEFRSAWEFLHFETVGCFQ